MNLGDRMKFYEKTLIPAVFSPHLPVIVRIDGCAFHTWTKGLRRPADNRLADALKWTTERLMRRCRALVGYTQSDEISLLLYTDSADSQLYFDGKRDKILTTLASSTTYEFYRYIDGVLPDKRRTDLAFDCKAFHVPTVTEAVNYFLWREQDAVKNSISMAASMYYTDSELHNKTSNERQEMLFAKGVNWALYSEHFKNGTLIGKRLVSRPFTTEEINNLPPLHNARKNSSLVVQRFIYQELPPLSSLATMQEMEMQLMVTDWSTKE